jgi:AhpD family alkylhydroperoxidase
MAEPSAPPEEPQDQEKKTESGKWPSYTMVEDRMRRIYFKFYKETYKKSEIDRKTKELISIAASLGFNCSGCLQRHIETAIQSGAS